jgi:hypothetical protein
MVESEYAPPRHQIANFWVPAEEKIGPGPFSKNNFFGDFLAVQNGHFGGAVARTKPKGLIIKDNLRATAAFGWRGVTPSTMLSHRLIKCS